MAISRKRLAALKPSDTNEHELFLNQADTEVEGILRIANTLNSEVTYKVAHTDVSGAADPEDWFIPTRIIDPFDTHEVSITMGFNESLRVQTETADSLVFQLTGYLETVIPQT